MLRRGRAPPPWQAETAEPERAVIKGLEEDGEDGEQSEDGDGPTDPVEDARRIFKMFDKDGSGSIDRGARVAGCTGQLQSECQHSD